MIRDLFYSQQNFLEELLYKDQVNSIQKSCWNTHDIWPKVWIANTPSKVDYYVGGYLDDLKWISGWPKEQTACLAKSEANGNGLSLSLVASYFNGYICINFLWHYFMFFAIWFCKRKSIFITSLFCNITVCITSLFCKRKSIFITFIFQESISISLYFANIILCPLPLYCAKEKYNNYLLILQKVLFFPIVCISNMHLCI